MSWLIVIISPVTNHCNENHLLNLSLILNKNKCQIANHTIIEHITESKSSLVYTKHNMTFQTLDIQYKISIK